MTSKQREAACSLMDWLHAERARVHYPPVIGGRIIRKERVSWIRSVADVRRRVLSPGGWTVDCSQCVTAILLAVGCRNPNGAAVDGYTGTLLSHLKHYRDGRGAYPGALVVFGGGTGHHVVMVRHRDGVHGDPLVFSQGQESDPRYLTLRQEASWQPAPVTFLAVSGL